MYPSLATPPRPARAAPVAVRASRQVHQRAQRADVTSLPPITSFGGQLDMTTGTIVTPRLRLRPWRDEDLPPFAALNADPLVMAHFPKVLSRAESDAMAARIRDFCAVQGFGLWAVDVPGV